MSEPVKEKAASKGIPDEITRELSVYGTRYRVVKKAFYNIDQMIDWLESRNEYLKDVIDTDMADRILSECPEALTLPDEDVPADTFEQVQFIAEYAKNMIATKTLKLWRTEIDLWGRYHGATEYGNRLQAMGIPEHVWKLAVNMNGSAPIAYSTIQELEALR